jgi:hypothetical protein
LDSRFFRIDDDKTGFFVYNLPQTWWSRKYEYKWVEKFARPGDIVLDAASGVFHPLKFFLADRCKKVYACDIDEDIKYCFSSQIPEEIATKHGFAIDELQKLINTHKNKINNLSSGIL